jgi:hypothetical protein
MHVLCILTLRDKAEKIEAGTPVELSFMPKDESDSHLVVELEETHERKIHVIIVSEDLSYFNHIHAEPEESGAYTVSETFPSGGKYIIYTDYKPESGANQTDKISVYVQGTAAKSSHYHEQKLVSTTDGYRVTAINADTFSTGSIEIPIVVEKNGRALKRVDIDNYLGAVAHIILVSQEGKDYIHIHPESTEAYLIVAHANIPKAGIYRMWVQFKTNDSVHTADFTFDIKNTARADEKKHNSGHAAHMH